VNNTLLRSATFLRFSGFLEGFRPNSFRQETLHLLEQKVRVGLSKPEFLATMPLPHFLHDPITLGYLRGFFRKRDLLAQDKLQYFLVGLSQLAERATISLPHSAHDPRTFGYFIHAFPA
jgi:hypothetical protein